MTNALNPYDSEMRAANERLEEERAGFLSALSESEIAEHYEDLALESAREQHAKVQMKPCYECGGWGVLTRRDEMWTCPLCHGSGLG